MITTIDIGLKGHRLQFRHLTYDAYLALLMSYNCDTYK